MMMMMLIRIGQETIRSGGAEIPAKASETTAGRNVWGWLNDLNGNDVIVEVDAVVVDAEKVPLVPGHLTAGLNGVGPLLQLWSMPRRPRMNGTVWTNGRAKERS